MHRLTPFALAVAACAPTDAAPKSDMLIELAAVTLDDDCAPTVAAAEPATPPAPSRRAPSQSGPGVVAQSRACIQTTMQLVIKSSAATTVAIKKVELLDDKGKVLQTLSPRAPMKWDGKQSGSYTAWNERLGAGDSVNAMYSLSAPNWGKLTNGRFNAHNKTFQLRVTVTAGDATQTVEKQAITVARLPPPVPT